MLVNGQRLELRDEYGRWTRNLKPGTYTIAASSPGYSEETRSLTLAAGLPESLTFSLRPVPGGLSIKPLTADAQIGIVNKGRNDTIGIYTGGVEKLSVEPGVYEVTISKRGYRTVTREVVVKPGESVYLEPPLELEATRLAARTRPGFTPDRATTVETARDGKYILVTLTGRSGDASAAVGTLEVLVAPVAQTGEASNAQGMLTGFPCQVDFVRIENVADFSFSETPGTGNQWRRTVVRLRPKDAKRAVRFSINWKSLRPGTDGGQ
ncbi:MAG TPA: carboxypeptidase regulatory-like domain-containing protein [Pyrinomonadaceae bacterium]